MLSHLRISAAKPAAKPFNLSDGQGLFLTVQPNGSKLWKLSFRHLGKQKTLHLVVQSRHLVDRVDDESIWV